MQLGSRTNTKGAKLAKDSADPQSIDKAKLRAYLEQMTQKRQINQQQMQWNLESLTIPAEVQDLFPNKVALFRQMRAFEYDLKSYIKAKVINVKEDILRKGQKVKRNLRLMLEVAQSSTQWTMRLEGRVLDGQTQEESLKSDEKFLQLFEKIKIEFIDDKGMPYTKYMPVIWQKNKSPAGASFDCIRVQRDFPED